MNMKMLGAILVGAISMLSVAHAQPVVPARPMPMPAEAPVSVGGGFLGSTAPVLVLPNGGYCMRFFVEGKGAEYVCTNAMDPKDKLTVDKVSQPELYAKIGAMKSGEVLAGNPRTKQIDIVRPVFDVRPVKAYADAASLVLGDASLALDAAKELVETEKKKLPATALGIVPIVKALNQNVSDTIEAIEVIKDISPRMPAGTQKRIALGALEDLEESLRESVLSIDKGIAKMKAFVPLMKGLVKTRIYSEEDLKGFEEGIRQGEVLRQFVVEQARQIRMFRTLHMP